MTDALEKLWAPRPVGPDTWQHWRIGPLDLWIAYVDGECRIAHASGEATPGDLVDEQPAPEGAPSQRFVLRVDSPMVRLRPRMPDRSVIVRPATPLTIMPGQDVVFFVSIPPWIQVELVAPGGRVTTLLEVPVVRLSNSWFGSPVDGELCYALKTRARRTMDAQVCSDRAICPLRIRNGAADPLVFDRLALKVVHLGVFQGRTHLWTNLGELVHQGAEDMTRINLKPGPPPYDDAATPLSDPRTHPEAGLMGRAFGSLRALNFFQDSLP